MKIKRDPVTDQPILSEIPRPLPGQRVKTEDGYIFTVMEDGTLTDGDMTWDSVELLAQEVDFEIIQDEEKAGDAPAGG